MFRSRFRFATPVDIATALRHMDLTHEQATDPTLLRKRYHELVIKYHPDAGGDAARLKEVVNGFAMLQGVTSNEIKTSFKHHVARERRYEESHVIQSPADCAHTRWPPPLYANGTSWLRDFMPRTITELGGLVGKGLGVYVVYCLVVRLWRSLREHHALAMEQWMAIGNRPRG